MTDVKILDPKDRFAFGKNWSRFLERLNEERIVEAENSLKQKLAITSLQGKTFLDIGSGSGLFSLAAYRLGAKVCSFDYDQDSVNCTKYLKQKYAPDDSNWTVEQGSVLDRDFVHKFGKVDILYSWGVLHHTGHMYQAFENIADLTKHDGTLFISIYNDQGLMSKVWTRIKKAYTNSNTVMKKIIVALSMLRLWGPRCIKDIFQHGNPFYTWKNYQNNNRGMSAYHDVVDWVGGYPFEVAKPEAVFSFFKAKGYVLENMTTCAGGIGCNEFVFQKK